MAAVEERAKSEHLKDVKEGVPYVKANKGIKRPSEHSSVIPSKKLKKPTSDKRKNGKKTNLVKKKSVSRKETNTQHTPGGKKSSQKPKKPL